MKGIGIERGMRMSNSVSNIKGSFKTTKAGSIEYRFYYYDENNINRKKSITAATAEECLRRANEFIKNKGFKSLRETPNIKLVEIIEKRIKDDYKKNVTGVQGYDRNMSTLRIIVRSSIGDMAIADITTKQLEAFLKEVRHYSTKVLHKIYHFKMFNAIL